MWKISYKNLMMLSATIPDPDLEFMEELETVEDAKRFLKIK